MLSAEAIDRLVAQVIGSGWLDGARRVQPPASRDGRSTTSAAIEGQITIESRRVALRLVLGKSFPLTLPKFFLVPWNALGFIPHVAEDGYVCFADSEGLVLDRHQPWRILAWAFERARRVLSDGVTGANHLHFVDEFEAYWLRCHGVKKYISLVEPLDDVRHVIVARSGDRPVLATSVEDLAAFHNGVGRKARHDVQPALYIPLEPGTVIVPPQWDRPFWTAADLRNAVLSGLSDKNAARLAELTARSRATETMVFRLVRPSGGTSFFGVRCIGVGHNRGHRVHPLRDGGTAERIVPLALARQDRTYLVPRGGAQSALSARRVLVLGAGSVGGRIAFELVRSGVLDVTIVDYDELTPENTFRHVLGRRAWGQYKASALKQAIESDLPYARVAPVMKKAQDAVADGTIEFNTFDTIISALGNPTVELELNERLHAGDNARLGAPSAIFTWLEPYGIGGHALLTRHSPGGGCFACLYADPDGTSQLRNRASFAAEGQSFGRALSGCGSLHTPYGALDAARTATIAVQLAIDSLTRGEKGNALRSWHGDASTFLAAGFRLSPRHTLIRREDQDPYAYAIPACPVCGDRTSKRVSSKPISDEGA